MPAPSQPSRAVTVPITAHLPKEIRDQLRILAVRRNRTMNDLAGEALADCSPNMTTPTIFSIILTTDRQLLANRR